jgi:phosphohistidine phosphatase
MPTLMLLRHAKSDSDNSKLGDHERPLSERGRNDAPRMGKVIRSEKWEPELVVCSTSERTRETWDLMAPEFKSEPKVRFDRTVYLAPPQTLLSIVQNAPSVASLMLIGHNPGMEDLALTLAAKPKTPDERARIESMARKYPTCALAVLEFDGAWRDVRPGTGRLVAFVKPKDLED